MVEAGAGEASVVPRRGVRAGRRHRSRRRRGAQGSRRHRHGDPARRGRPWPAAAPRPGAHRPAAPADRSRPSPPNSPQTGVTAISLDGLPRTVSRAQAMDVLSSQASVAGYRAALLAATTYDRYFPLLVTAAGTARPAEVLVLGAGVAGLQAIATARRLGAIVKAYDVRPTSAAEVKSLGATFLRLGLRAVGRGRGRVRPRADPRGAAGPAGRAGRPHRPAQRRHHHRPGARPAAAAAGHRGGGRRRWPPARSSSTSRRARSAATWPGPSPRDRRHRQRRDHHRRRQPRRPTRRRPRRPRSAATSARCSRT